MGHLLISLTLLTLHFTDKASVAQRGTETCLETYSSEIPVLALQRNTNRVL